MKKIMVLVLIILSSHITVFAEDRNDLSLYIVETSVKINDAYLFSDTSHLLMHDTVFVVSKYLVEAFGGTIEWFADTQTVKIVIDDRQISVVIGSNVAVVDGKEITLYKAPFIKEGRTMLPLKFITQQIGCTVLWEQETFTVVIEKEAFNLPDELRTERSYSDDDLLYLAKIVTVESGDKSLEMAMAIANTVLNRVKDDRFPNTVYDVIYQIDRYVQFPPAHKSSFESLIPSELSLIAAKKSLEGINPIGYSLYFNNQPFKSKSNDLIRIIDGEYFYY